MVVSVSIIIMIIIMINRIEWPVFYSNCVELVVVVVVVICSRIMAA